MQFKQIGIRLLSHLALAVTTLSSQGANAASSTVLGSTDSLRCFEESRLVLGEHGLDFCDRAIEKGSLTRRDLGATYSNRGIIHANNGKFSLALADHNKAISLLPQMGQAYINRGNTHFQMRDFESAISDYEKAVELEAEPRHIPYYNMALALLQMKRIGEARVAFEQALQYSPGSTKIIRQLEDLEGL